MTDSQEWQFDGYDGKRVARTWGHEAPRYVALLCHGYGEHIGRYEYVAGALVRHGAVVHGVDHVGHGKSDGERVSVPDYERVVDDFHALTIAAKAEHPGLPVVLVGHSMGGMIGARYAQRHRDELTALVLSGPVLGRWDTVTQLRKLEEIPDTPIDPETLSRDLAVGRAYADDPLVWHGRFRRETLDALAETLDTITRAGSLGDVPTLWVHGEEDQLVPLDGTSEGIDAVKGSQFEQRLFAGARHEVFNETNRDEVLDTVTTFVDRVITR